MRVKVLKFIPLLVMIALLNGCFWLFLGAGAGAAGAAYQMGKVKVVENVDIFTAHDACLRGLQDLRIPVRRKEVDATAGKISAFTADDKELRIELRRLSDETTELTIKTLPIPDKDRTLTVHDAVQRHIDSAARARQRTSTP